MPAGAAMWSKGSNRLKLLLRALPALMLLSWLGGCASTTGLLFFPQQAFVRTPADLGLAHDNVVLRTSDGVKLFSWYLPAKGESRGSVLFLHGNGQNISTHIVSVAWLPEAGYNVLLLDYRGYGRSGGEAKLPDVFRDIEAATEWMSTHTPAPRFVLGQSLGASLAVASMGPGQRAAYKGLVLDAPFANYQEISNFHLQKSVMGVVASPAVLLLPNSYQPIDSIHSNKLPKLFFTSPNDQVVPMDQTMRLYAAAPDPKQLSTHQGQHIATFTQPGQRQVMLQFMQAQAEVRASTIPIVKRVGGGGGQIEAMGAKASLIQHPCRTCSPE